MVASFEEELSLLIAGISVMLAFSVFGLAIGQSVIGLTTALKGSQSLSSLTIHRGESIPFTVQNDDVVGVNFQGPIKMLNGLGVLLLIIILIAQPIRPTCDVRLQLAEPLVEFNGSGVLF